MGLGLRSGLKFGCWLGLGLNLTRLKTENRHTDRHTDFVMYRVATQLKIQICTENPLNMSSHLALWTTQFNPRQEPMTSS